MTTILVTGATGFVGRHLCRVLAVRGFKVVGLTRHAIGTDLLPQVQLATVENTLSCFDLEPAMKGVDIVVHLAARAHVMFESSPDPLGEYLHVNLGVTEAVATAAVRTGVSRLVFLSTIKVIGESTSENPFTEWDEPKPVDPYGVSKLRAEQFLADLSRATGLETVVIRPPLVYGPGVRGNFLRMLGLAARKIPMPLGSIVNARSLISIANLCDVIVACLSRPEAVGRHFLVSDGEDVSTPDLFRMLAASMGRQARLLPVPVAMLRFVASIARRSAEVERLCDSLRVDISPTREALGWSPPQSLLQGISKVTEWYLGARESGNV